MSDVEVGGSGGGPNHEGGKKIRTAFFTLAGGGSINMRQVGNYEFTLTQDHIARGITIVLQLNGPALSSPAPLLFGTAAALTNGLVFNLIRGGNTIPIFAGPLKTNADMMLASSRVDVLGTLIQFTWTLFEEVELHQEDVLQFVVQDSTQASLASFRTFMSYELVEGRPSVA